MRALPRAVWGPALASCWIGAASATGQSGIDPMTRIDRVVAGVRRAARIDRPRVEAILRTGLRKTEHTGPFALYEAGGLRLGGITLDVDLRVPAATGDATAGPLLVLRIAGACLRKAEIEARYAPWTLTNVPHGHSRAEETSWTRSEAWGTLSFGFPESRPDCLRSIVFNGRREEAPR